MRVTKFVVVAFSALDALLALVIGLAIPLIPLTVMWVTRLDSGLAWDVYWRASADIWLLITGCPSGQMPSVTCPRALRLIERSSGLASST